MKKVGAREEVQCSNDNCFLGLDVNVALSGCPIGCYIVGDAPNIAKNKNNKTPCIQMLKIVTKKVCYLSVTIPEPAEYSLL